MAEEAVAYVSKKLWRGAGNRPDSPPDGGACVAYGRSTMVSTSNFIPHLAQRAIADACGNCGEQAAVAYMFLLRRGARPLDYMYLNNSGGTPIHSFVLMAFTPDGEDEASGWGKDAVVCDPWDDGQAYPAWQIAQKMSLFVSGCTATSYRRD
jgi:hypothetical protein